MSQFDSTARPRPQAAVEFIEGPPGRDGSTHFVAAGEIGAALALDLAGRNDTLLVATLTANATITVSGLTAGAQFRLLLKQDTPGGRTASLTDGTSTLALPLNPAAGDSTVLDCVSPNGTDIVIQL